MKIDQKQREKDILHLMSTLKIDRTEAEKLWIDDFAIDQGFDSDYDLSKEQTKASNKYRGTGTRVVNNTTSYQFKRERKTDEVKQQIVSELFDALKKSKLSIEDLTISNKERELTFSVDNRSYTVTLTKHNKKGS